MTTNDIITLVNAGFSKAEILALAENVPGNEPKTEPENGAQNIPDDVKETPKEEQPKQEQPAQIVAPLMTDAQVKQLAQALNIGNASIDIPPTVTVDDQMAEHFKNLLLGKE